jgi:hypothetical protein
LPSIADQAWQRCQPVWVGIDRYPIGYANDRPPIVTHMVDGTFDRLYEEALVVGGQCEILRDPTP